MQSVGQSAVGRTAGAEHSLQTFSLQVERKHFTFDLRENPRGRFLRITEEVNGRYDSIIIPITGLEQFRDVLNEIVKVAQANPPKS